ncbi:MAG: VWA domain-containing protein [Firmicutes bacterium]|nr:VWA domain-containing protein [Bacillota bacterium]
MTASHHEGGRDSLSNETPPPRAGQPPQSTPPGGAKPIPQYGTTAARDLLSEGSRDLIGYARADIVQLAQARPEAVAAVLGNAQVAEVFVDASEPQSVVQVYRSIRDRMEMHRRRELLKRIVDRISKAAATLSEARKVRKPSEVRAYRPGDADWDLDYTLERLSENPGKALTYDDIRATASTPPGLAVCLIADKSQSVGGMLHDIAVACAVACYRLRDESLSVLLFDKSVEFARHFEEEGTAERVIERVIDMDAGGATDLFKPLVAAKGEFESIPASRSRKAILVTDLVATRGHDPVPVARDLPSLKVVCVPGFRNELPALSSAFRNLDNTRFVWADSSGSVTEAMLELIASE